MPDTNPDRPAPIRVVGARWAPRTHEVKDFLARGRIPYLWFDPDESDEGRRLLEEAGGASCRLPLLLFADGARLQDPTDAELAEKVGLDTEPESPFYDLVVVGGGPAGLAAAVYGASEGLRTLILERRAPGGQAGQSARIENYLGFPEGIAGGEFARRAVEQGEKFGVEIVVAREATALERAGGYHRVTLDDGGSVGAHAVLLSLGVDWQTLEAPGCSDLVGAGIYYGAAAAEAAAVRGRDVYMLGAGNSAGQAALLLARYARSVTLLALEKEMTEKMSRYLVDRIRATGNVRFRPCCTVESARGEGRLERITIREMATGKTEEVLADALFVFIGAAPRTEWLEGTVSRDDNGYLLTGRRVPKEAWKEERDPQPLETSLPGCFAAGDVRAGSVKRVGSAVGEGSMALQQVHDFLANR
ncbi:MAG TPA: FAD-dependent oxidoreductase [Longimicrobium sp.]|nr:FAD-dependent oxidoreductase [Longimicrobium sp.]